MTDPRIKNIGSPVVPQGDVIISPVKRRDDGTRYREMVFPEFTITGTVPFAQEIANLAAQKKPLDVFIYIDSSSSMKLSHFTVLAQMARLIELCEKSGIELRISISYFHDGIETEQVPLIRADDAGKAKFVEGILTIPFGNTLGGETVGSAVEDAAEKAAKLPADEKKAVIVFHSAYSLTDMENEQIEEAKDAGNMVFTVEDIMNFLPTDSGKMMTRVEAVEKVTAILKPYQNYKGRDDVVRRFEGETSFLMKLSFALSLANNKDPLDVSFNITWDRRFRCERWHWGEESPLCLEPYHTLEDSARVTVYDEKDETQPIWPRPDEMLVSGALGAWDGTENYYYYLYQLSHAASDEDAFRRGMGTLTYDIINTHINHEMSEERRRRNDTKWHIGNIGNSYSVSDEPQRLLEYFVIDPFTLIYTIKRFNSGELMSLFSEEPMKEDGTETYDPRPYQFGVVASGVRTSLARHIQRQFKFHDDSWRREQLDKITKFCERAIFMTQEEDVQLFIFLLENVPGLKGTAMVSDKVAGFVGHITEVLRRNVPLTDEDRVIIHTFERYGLLTDAQKRAFTKEFVRVLMEEGKTPKNYYWLYMTAPDESGINYFIENYSGTEEQYGYFEFSLKNKMTPVQLKKMLDNLSDDKMVKLFKADPAIFLKFGDSQKAADLLMDVLDEMDDPLLFLDKLFALYTSGDPAVSQLGGDVLKIFKEYGWDKKEKLMLLAMEAIVNKDTAEAVKLIMTQLLPATPQAYKKWREKPECNGFCQYAEWHELRDKTPLTYVDEWLKSLPPNELAEAVLVYLMDGNDVQREMAGDVLFSLAGEKGVLDGPGESVLTRLETIGFDRRLAEFIFKVMIWYRCPLKDGHQGRFVQMLAANFDPEKLDVEASPNYANASQIRDDQIWIWSTLSTTLSDRWGAIPPEGQPAFFIKISAALEKMLAYSKPDYFVWVLDRLDGLDIPLGADRKEGDAFLMEVFIPTLAGWMAASRGREVDVREPVVEYMAKVGLTGPEYAVIMDEIYAKYFKDVNYSWFTGMALDAFSKNQREEFSSYLKSVVASSAYSDEFKDMLIGYFLKPAASSTTTGRHVEQSFDKEKMEVEESSYVGYECYGDHGYSGQGDCKVLFPLLKTTFEIAMDKGTPLKYRTKMMSHAYALAIKFAPGNKDIPDFAALCQQLIADTETKKIGEYYLKKWQDFRAGMEGQR